MDSSIPNVPKQSKWPVVVVIAVAVFLVTAAVLLYVLVFRNCCEDDWLGSLTSQSVDDTIVAFNSPEEFQAYVGDIDSSSGLLNFSDSSTSGVMEFDSTTVQDAGLGDASPLGFNTKSTSRYSETNVQVKGIDEPDIVKTDGNEIYISSELSKTEQKLNGETREGISVVNTSPLDDLDLVSGISGAGDLLLSDDILLNLWGDGFGALDVKNPANPEPMWDYSLDDDSYIESARLFNDTLYVVIATKINYETPCPVAVLYDGAEATNLECRDIYHPVLKVPVSVTFTALQIYPETGAVKEKVSFVGAPDSSVVYMSEDNLYVTFAHPIDFSVMMYDFFNEAAAGVMSDYYLSKLKKVSEYDLSQETKMLEMEMIFEEWAETISDEEMDRLDDVMEEKMETYFKDHLREFTTTTIVKADVDTFKLRAVGDVPGFPLNQFSLDEYEDHLRITITAGDSMGFAPESMNDLYVLDNKLNIVGSVLDLGKGESIYSTRLIEDRGYMVTFRQTDPFYVFDLSDPKNPQQTGELKIPGFSSYLHPLAKDLILGTGEEDSKVKVSLFDVSDPRAPQEVSKFNLNEYDSDVLDTHHAFLHDPEHGVFFVPGADDGYIFSYKDNTIKLEKRITDIKPQRALYVNDYLYIVGMYKMVVLSENTWEQVATVQLYDEKNSGTKIDLTDDQGNVVEEISGAVPSESLSKTLSTYIQ